MCTIEYFDSPSKRHLREVRSETLLCKTLGPNTRIYLYDEALDRWEVGRVLHDDGSSLEVRLSGRVDAVVPHERVFVRWKKPISDPVEFLACGIAETPQYAEARSNFLASYLAQRAATGGVTALLSSAIELNSHQVDIVRRVLTDPTQRYLLADEVGLGKTIEAGVIIRQAVLDDPQGHNVVVLVPPALVQQWQQELVDRFGLAAYLDDSVFVVSYDNESEVVVRLKAAKMLVIDEAHHIASNRDPHGLAIFDHVSSAAKQVQRLLLLSATPVLRNETGFLRMLHLLDPDIYSLDREEDFRTRVQHRQQLAEAVAVLEPQNSLYFDPFLDDLARILPSDERLAELISNVRSQLEALPEQDDPEFVGSVRLLRTHLSETYRLHRRILRNRRRHVKWLTPNRSGSHARLIHGSNWIRLETAFENWRIGAVASSAGIGTTVAPNCLVDFCSSVLRALLTDPLSVGQLCLARSQAESSHFLGEADLLTSLAAASSLLGDRVCLKQDLAVTVISEFVRRGTKVVVFCSSADIADSLFAHVSTSLKGEEIVRHGVIQFGEDADENREAAWLRFQSEAATKVIVCDQSAEEGINLQGGRKAVLHFDLPMNPNRIEQRLGRLDRYSTGDPIESVVLIDEESAIESAWYAVLRDGLRVFEHSISSLQYLIDEQMRSLEGRIFLDGVDALAALCESFAGNEGLVAKEINRLEQQDALDELAPSEEEKLDAILDVDAEWQVIRDATSQWAIGALLFEVVPSRLGARDHPISPPFRFKYAPPGNGGHATLIPISNFIDRFIGALDFAAPGGSSRQPMSYAHSYHRKTAIKSKARPMRYGCEFGEALKVFSDVDDRGRSYVCWRQVKGILPTPSHGLYFRFRFLIEANTGPVEEFFSASHSRATADALPSARRRLDSVLAPAVVEIWLDENGRPPSTEATELLTGAYDKAGIGGLYLDTNLRTGRLERIQSKMPDVFGQWGILCRRVRDSAIDLVTTSADFRARLENAKAANQIIQELRLSQLAARIEHLRGREAAGELEQKEFEERFGLAVEHGITHPTLKIDVVGAVWLTTEPFPLSYDE
jgi:ATP-dependent helicase HepA